mmetsp:Transcript_3227/g.8063  ORF Transcript_3227/g.8063 Transcript_3227/m.8063 type:complete len:301 (+) Transcript_3227:100-1002(+)|eukprot:CAMPEP_0183404300 /NCGR_PEP_ID=MMETSP0370-20130417/15082_1 /TAXON_ID=268820 /ORGANISM="Peridinium aciculiferum, Strain PAER-2" /LENGTH=300 /DNA_ID=CAMNT_0025586135 /DNA_START=53 /DNA_END=955 /DNA_ORIENTATION=-
MPVVAQRPDAISDDFLDAFEAALSAPKSEEDEDDRRVPSWPMLGQGLVNWPMEIRRGIAGYLPWRDVLADACLCRSWWSLEQDIPLWWVHFLATWPMHARRQVARVSGQQDWRQLFRDRWLRGDRDGDATAEDWLDFYAAQEAVKGREVTAVGASGKARSLENVGSRDLQLSLQRCRAEVVRAHGIHLPEQVDTKHLCNGDCRFHRLPDVGDAFVCEGTGVLHQCRKGEPCHICVVSPDDCFLVCPASGITYDRPNYIDEEAPDEVDVWDPANSESQQIARWFEHGYGMSEEQADTFFDD